MQTTAPDPGIISASPSPWKGRRGIFARIGAVTVGVAAASVLSQHKAQAASAPACCYGLPSCNGVGCNNATSCCWYCCSNSYLFKCCDNLSSGCICAYSVSRC